MIKNLFLTALLTYSLSCSHGYSQVYEKIYAESTSEIQDRIDANKILGNDILTGIFSDHQVGLSNLTIAKMDRLKTLLSKNDEIIFFQVADDMKSVFLTSKGWFTREKLVELLQIIEVQIVGYQISYHL